MRRRVGDRGMQDRHTGSGSEEKIDGGAHAAEPCIALADRIRQKIADYAHYKFTVRETRALNIFFDLAQEYDDLHYLHILPVQILEFFFDSKARLYARDDKGVFVAQTPLVGPEAVPPPIADLAAGPKQSDAWWFFPVKGRPARGKTVGEQQADPSPQQYEEREVLAILAICPEMPLTVHEKLFYEKFANRLGFSLHNRILALRNREHIDFVRTLVHDIGHNVIVPNLHFKLLMRQMAGKITALRKLSETFTHPHEDDIASLHELCYRIDAHYQEISKHFHQSSFFLETLLRQSHFDQGRYVLQRSEFNLVSRVVAPQFERYRLRFQERDIEAEEEYDPNTAGFTVNADMGLLSQVVANLLSNAVKYTRETPGASGLRVKCSVQAMPEYFGPAKDGVRVAVLSSGDPIPEGESEHLFTESFRASNSGDEHGTGHGLYFSHLIVSQHDGDSGYARTPEGNLFYLTIPAQKRRPAIAPAAGKEKTPAAQAGQPPESRANPLS